MSIDIPKIIYIYVIIIAIMYVSIIKGNVVKDVNSFKDRQNGANEEIMLSTDYNSRGRAEDYLKYFIKNLNTMKSTELATFFDTDYYKNYESDIKKSLSSKARIKNTSKNTSYIEFVRKDVNEKNENIYVYNILVVKKGMDYKEGFNLLIEEKSADRNKSIDIYVVEKSPYSFSLQIPEKEFVG